jgi:hypothetical protein
MSCGNVTSATADSPEIASTSHATLLCWTTILIQRIHR